MFLVFSNNKLPLFRQYALSCFALRTIGANAPHYWCLPIARHVPSTNTSAKDGKKGS